jgi:hypothetical protein
LVTVVGDPFPERVLAIGHELLFHCQNPLAAQKGVRLRFGGDQVLDGQDEQFQLHQA